MNPYVAESVLLANAMAALQDCAARRGHRVTARELERALLQVPADTPDAVVDAAWHWLFPGERLASVPVSLAGAQHFPALLHADGGWRVIADATGLPASGILRVPVADAGVLREAPPPEARPATAAIRGVLKAHAPLFVRAGIATVFINLLAIVTSIFAMQVYDRVVPNFSYATLWVLALGVSLAILFDVVFKFLRLAITEKLTLRADEALSQYLFEKVMAIKLDRRPARVGTLIAQVRDYEAVKAFFTSTTLFTLADLPFIVLFLAVIFLLGGWQVALVPVLLLPVCLGIGLLAQRPLALLQQQQMDESAQRQGLLIEVLQGAESVKAQAGEWRFSLLWQQVTRRLAEQGLRIRTLGGRAQFVAGAFQQLAYVLVLVVGVYSIEAGVLTMGGLIACTILASRAMASITQVTNILVQWHHARHALDVLDRLLSLPGDDDELRQGSSVAAAHDITVTGIEYRYDEGKDVQLAIDSLQVRAGERVAVLGRNGSGKSTLLRLLAGLATPATGEVRIAGLDLQTCRQGWLRETVGYLPQDVRLFGGTLRENLLMGLAVPDEERLRAALASTGLDRLVQRLPQGLDTVIREGGSGLSGGQRQLVGLTRLVLQQPCIWLLDEPSASLDRDAEQQLMAVLRSLPATATLVFTTHRLGWLPLSQRTILLEDGHVRADVPTGRVRSGNPPPAEAGVLAAGTPVANAPAPNGVTDGTD